jgi:hypothetical protein
MQKCYIIGQCWEHYGKTHVFASKDQGLKFCSWHKERAAISGREKMAKNFIRLVPELFLRVEEDCSQYALSYLMGLVNIFGA